MENLDVEVQYRIAKWIFTNMMFSGEITLKVLNRRSDRKSYTREGFIEMLKYYPLAMPKIYVSLF